jgi:hypothetical protein
MHAPGTISDIGTTIPARHRIQRVFARATETIRFRGLSAALGGFLLLLFFARQRKVKGESWLIWYGAHGISKKTIE